MKSYGMPHETIVVFTVAGTHFGIAANAIEEVCGIEDLKTLPPDPMRPRVVKQSILRRGQEHLVVDARLYFRMPAAQTERVLILRNAPVAVSIGNVDRMQEISAIYRLPRAFHGEECRWYRGLAKIATNLVPIVRAESFISAARVMGRDIAHSPSSSEVAGASA